MLAPIAGSRRDGKSSFRTLTRYLTEGRDPVTDEIVERGEHLLSDNLLSRETAAAEMRAVGFENPRVTDPVYHYQLSAGGQASGRAGRSGKKRRGRRSRTSGLASINSWS